MYSMYAPKVFKTQKMKAVYLFCIIPFILTGCQQKIRKHQMLGNWQIIDIKSSGRSLSSFESFGLTSITFDADGTYRSMKSDEDASGKWKLRGKKLQLYSPAVKDLNGKTLAQERASEWEVFVTDGWMHWTGTSKYSQQHLQITWKNHLSSTSMKPYSGHWYLTGDGRQEADLVINPDHSFHYKAKTTEFEGMWQADEQQKITLISAGNPDTSGKQSITLGYARDTLFFLTPKGMPGKDSSYFVRKVKE